MRKVLSLFLLAAVTASPSTRAASVKATITNQTHDLVEGAVIYAFPVQPDGSTLKKGCEGEKCTPQAVVQKGMAFEPEVTVIQAGTKLTFPNQDKVKHQVYSLSPTKKFELPLYSVDSMKQENLPSVIFDKGGEVVLGCNIHDYMKAYVFVVESPFFAVSQKGVAQLAGIPKGTYLLQVWHPLGLNKAKFPMKQIEITAEAAVLDWSVELNLKKATKKATHTPVDMY